MASVFKLNKCGKTEWFFFHCSCNVMGELQEDWQTVLFDYSVGNCGHRWPEQSPVKRRFQ